MRVFDNQLLNIISIVGYGNTVDITIIMIAIIVLPVIELNLRGPDFPGRVVLFCPLSKLLQGY
jgi:hypothetical protein